MVKVTKINKFIKINPEDIPHDFWGWTQAKLLDFCKSSPFPGTKKYPADHPIWDCWIAGAISPKEAWKSEAHLKKAIYNLFWILYKSRDVGPKFYPDFVKVHEQAFKAGGVELLRKVLARFTISKIAPKVTALMPCVFKDIIDESGIDISCGVYAPMAGFGGIIEGTKQWFTERGLEPNIEAYDINPYFCKYFGWKQQDVLAQKITTKKIVIACPPFGQDTEHWLGTDDKNLFEFNEWCELIKKQIKSPNYIFIGPETSQTGLTKFKSGVKSSGLFHKKIGVAYYPEYSMKNK